MPREWTHALCERCWTELYGKTKPPYRFKATNPEEQADQCCLCASATESGIFVRLDPGMPGLWCKGTRGRHAA